MELRRRRVRAHVPPASLPRPRHPWSIRPDEPALLVHLLADDLERLTTATTRELLITAAGPVTINERIYAPGDQLDAIRPQSGTMRSDAVGALGAVSLHLDRTEALGQLICRRSYLQRWPLVAWNLERTLGRLAAHTGPAHGRADGFSVSLVGTGIYRDARWAPSWHYPTLRMRPLADGTSGAFLSWKHPQNDMARTKRGERPADFLSLQRLSSALIGGELDEPKQVCRWLDVDWPTEPRNQFERLRAEARALTHLYGQALTALGQVAPGLAPQHVYSFGSIANHALHAAGVLAPLRKACDGADR